MTSYTGIGSRETPEHVLQVMTRIARVMAKRVGIPVDDLGSSSLLAQYLVELEHLKA